LDSGGRSRAAPDLIRALRRLSRKPCALFEHASPECRWRRGCGTGATRYRRRISPDGREGVQAGVALRKSLGRIGGGSACAARREGDKPQEMGEENE
jgi:hypothetical protein